jgi:hypothetical protein
LDVDPGIIDALQGEPSRLSSTSTSGLRALLDQLLEQENDDSSVSSSPLIDPTQPFAVASLEDRRRLLHETEEDADSELRNAIVEENIRSTEDYVGQSDFEPDEALTISTFDEERIMHPTKYFRGLDKLEDEIRRSSTFHLLKHKVSP